MIEIHLQRSTDPRSAIGRIAGPLERVVRVDTVHHGGSIVDLTLVCLGTGMSFLLTPDEAYRIGDALIGAAGIANRANRSAAKETDS